MPAAVASAGIFLIKEVGPSFKGLEDSRVHFGAYRRPEEKLAAPGEVWRIGGHPSKAKSFTSFCVEEPQAAHLVWPPPGSPVLLSFGCVAEGKKKVTVCF